MIIIRADGNVSIGAGHLMRCLTIADAVRTRLGGVPHGLAPRMCGENTILFVCADEESGQLVLQHGYPVWVLGTDYRNMEEELPLWQKRFAWDNPSQNILLADSYFVTIPYLAHLRRYGILVLLDDMGKQTYPADVVINYNAFAKQTVYQRLYAGTGTRCMTGSSFVPVRPQFAQGDYALRDSVEDVLITTGGGDSRNIAAGILGSIYTAGIRYHVVTGRFNPYMQELKAMEATHPGVRIYHDVTDMAGLMRSCDLAVTAGGTTVYELAAVGVPFVCFSYAENQEALAEYVGRKGIGGYGGAFHKEPERTLAEIAGQIRSLASDADLRRSYHQGGRSMTDGLGASRLADILLADVIH